MRKAAGTVECCALERQTDSSGNENKCSLEILAEVTQFLVRSLSHGYQIPSNQPEFLFHQYTAYTLYKDATAEIANYICL